MANKVFYHNDADGRCAGAIVYRELEQCEMYEMDYTKKFPMDNITRDDIVYMVDFCLEPFEDMLLLRSKCRELVWIDHHVSVMKQHEKYSNIHIAGVRDTSVSACYLTWQYFHPNKVIPLSVAYISDRDIWKFQYGDDTRNFYGGLECIDYLPESYIWDDLFSDELTNKLIHDGKTVNKYRKQVYRELVRSFGFITEFEGHKCLACNQGKASSELFESYIGDYEIMMPFVYEGVSKLWRVSLYSKSVDVSAIAEKYKGGGHKYAAGFECLELPFLVNDCGGL